MSLARGNAAKLYCLRRIEQRARGRDRFRIVDLGAGDAANFLPLLRAYPQIEYVAVEPDAAACTVAERNLAGLHASVINAPAYDVDLEPADVVASFSVLEHVYDRPAYLRAVARTLAPDGTSFVNYDAGHFVRPTLRDRAKTLVGPWLARLGREQWYQSFVREADFRRDAEAAGLEVVETKSFNTDLKRVYRLVPEQSRDAFTAAWLDLELRANELVEPYRDEHATLFMTRNAILRRVRS